MGSREKRACAVRSKSWPPFFFYSLHLVVVVSRRTWAVWSSLYSWWLLSCAVYTVRLRISQEGAFDKGQAYSMFWGIRHKQGTLTN